MKMNRSFAPQTFPSAPHVAHRPVARCLVLAALLGLAAGCTGQTAEERAREAAEQIKESIPDVEAIALAQPVEASVVEEVQRQLTALHEYQGEINGKLDSVTVNAIQAFQRSVGLKDDGILDAHTREKLTEAAARAGS